MTVQSSNALPAVESKPAEGAFAGIKKLWGGFQDPQPEELAPVLSSPASSPTPMAAPATPAVATPIPSPNLTTNPTPNSTPASGNIEGVKPYEPPSLLNSFQQLFN